MREQGYEILARNLETPVGECDILAEHDDRLIFVEVKTRGSSRYGPPELAVHREKRDQLRRVAKFELREREHKNCQFDVIAIEFDMDEPELRHIKSAFGGVE